MPLYARGERTSNGLGIITGNGQAKTKWDSQWAILLDKAPRLSISIVIWILSSDTICQLNQFNTNSEAAMLSTTQLTNVVAGLVCTWGMTSPAGRSPSGGEARTSRLILQMLNVGYAQSATWIKHIQTFKENIQNMCGTKNVQSVFLAALPENVSRLPPPHPTEMARLNLLSVRITFRSLDT